jgi:hypothetical protein
MPPQPERANKLSKRTFRVTLLITSMLFSFLPRDVIRISNKRNKNLAAQRSDAGLALRFAKSICTLIRSTHSGKTRTAQ